MVQKDILMAHRFDLMKEILFLLDSEALSRAQTDIRLIIQNFILKKKNRMQRNLVVAHIIRKSDI